MSLTFSLILVAVPYMLEVIAFGFLPSVGIRIDPIYLFLVSVCDMETVSSLYSSYSFLLTVMILYLSILSEMSRLLAIIGLGLILITFCTIQTLIKINRDTINQGVQEYKQLTIIQSIGTASNSFIVLITMGVGYCILVFYSAVTIIGLRLLPLEIYWIFPLVTLVCVIMLLVALPNGTKCYNISSNLIQTWKSDSQVLCRARYKNKILRTLRPICFHFGSYREVNNEAKTIYVYSVMEQVMTLVLVLQSY